MGLPLVLENMLEAIISNGTLKTWNIYQDYYGNINVKLQFSDHHEPVRQVRYKRQSQKQVERDNNRSRQYKNKRLRSEECVDSASSATQPLKAADHPQENAPAHCDYVGVRTISMAKDTPEILRTEGGVHDSSLNPHADSFIIPVSPEEPISPLSTSPVLSTLTSVKLYIPDNENMSTTPTPSVESLSFLNEVPTEMYESESHEEEHMTYKENVQGATTVNDGEQGSDESLDNKTFEALDMEAKLQLILDRCSIISELTKTLNSNTKPFKDK